MSDERAEREPDRRVEGDVAAERVGLRELDEHASWREVYLACHVQVGHDDE